MNHFTYNDNQLFAEQIPLADIAGQFGTPCYVYSRAAFEAYWQAFDQAFNDTGRAHLICYAVKANSNIAVLNVLAKLGSGFDIVSVGELERVVKAGGDPAKTIFSGVGKQPAEIRRALELGIHCFNVESEPELDVINTIAGEMGCQAPISIRVNPDVDVNTHPYISTGLKENKFGVDIETADKMYDRAANMPNIEIIGVDCHIGSQLTELAPFIETLDRLLALVDRLAARGIDLKHIDLGGGFGICYKDEVPPDLNAFARELEARLGERAHEIILEPGRAIAGNAGVLLTQIDYLKHAEHKNFAVVDAAMNDLIRPSLYSAWMNIVPVRQALENGPVSQQYDVVGPVCETGDFLGKSRDLAVETGDLLAILSAGAYSFVMSSNYNTRPRAAEVMVDGGQVHLVRQRETLDDVWRGEQLLP